MKFPKVAFCIFSIMMMLVCSSGFTGALKDIVNSPKIKPLIQKDSIKDYQYGLAVTAIFQDEAPFLKEWLEYYRMMGVSHFYLYNNLSTDNFLEILQPYIDNQEVELVDWPFQSSNVAEYDVIQCNSYRDALSKAVGKAKWLAVIDIDEFIVPVQDNSLIELLARFDNPFIGGICCVWVFFGTSHVEHIPSDKLMIETLTLNGGPCVNFWEQGSYKSIVRPERVAALTSPHYCFYKTGVNHQAMPYSLAQINHYWTRDEFFLNHIKAPRRAVWGYPVETTLAWANGMNTQSPFSFPILKFVPSLRQRMGLSDEN